MTCMQLSVFTITFLVTLTGAEWCDLNNDNDYESYCSNGCCGTKCCYDVNKFSSVPLIVGCCVGGFFFVVTVVAVMYACLKPRLKPGQPVGQATNINSLTINNSGTNYPNYTSPPQPVPQPPPYCMVDPPPYSLYPQPLPTISQTVSQGNTVDNSSAVHGTVSPMLSSHSGIIAPHGDIQGHVCCRGPSCHPPSFPPPAYVPRVHANCFFHPIPHSQGDQSPRDTNGPQEQVVLQGTGCHQGEDIEASCEEVVGETSCQEAPVAQRTRTPPPAYSA